MTTIVVGFDGSPQRRRVSDRRAIRTWTVAWLGGALIGVANGVLRESSYGRRVGEASAHRLSGATAVTAFAAYFAALQRRRPIPTAGEAWAIGGIWLALTVAFEFGFGRAVARQSWDELLADFDLAHGRTWPLVLAWIAVGPSVTRAVVPRGPVSGARRPAGRTRPVSRPRPSRARHAG